MCYVLTKNQTRTIAGLGFALCVLSLVSSVASLLAIRGLENDRREREKMMMQLLKAQGMAASLLEEARALEGAP